MLRVLVRTVVFLAVTGASQAAPVTAINPISASGVQLHGIYAYSDAADTVQLNMIDPNAINNIFCNHSGSGCVASSTGQIFNLGQTGTQLTFSINNLTTGFSFRSDQLENGFSHALVSDTVDVADAASVAAAYAVYGVGALASETAAAISGLAETLGGQITFIGWEDTAGAGDFDYNDLIFAYVDSPVLSQVVDPSTNFVPGGNTPPGGNGDPAPEGDPNSDRDNGAITSLLDDLTGNTPRNDQATDPLPEPEGLGLVGFLVYGLYAMKRRKKINAGSSASSR